MKRNDANYILNKLSMLVERSYAILTGKFNRKIEYDMDVYQKVRQRRRGLSIKEFRRWTYDRAMTCYDNNKDDILGDILCKYSLALAVIRSNPAKKGSINAIMSTIIARYIQELDSKYNTINMLDIIRADENTIDPRESYKIELPMLILLDYMKSYTDRRWLWLRYIKDVMGYTQIEFSNISRISVTTLKEVSRTYNDVHRTCKSKKHEKEKKNTIWENNKAWAYPNCEGAIKDQPIYFMSKGHMNHCPGILLRLRRTIEDK